MKMVFLFAFPLPCAGSGPNLLPDHISLFKNKQLFEGDFFLVGLFFLFLSSYSRFCKLNQWWDSSRSAPGHREAAREYSKSRIRKAEGLIVMRQ